MATMATRKADKRESEMAIAMSFFDMGCFELEGLVSMSEEILAGKVGVVRVGGGGGVV